MAFFDSGRTWIRWYPVPASIAKSTSYYRRINGLNQLIRLTNRNSDILYLTNGKQVWSNVKHI